MPTCTNCTDWCVHCPPPNEHINRQSLACSNTDASHVPALPCRCKRERDPQTGEWTWKKPGPPEAPCPKHGAALP